MAEQQPRKRARVGQRCFLRGGELRPLLLDGDPDGVSCRPRSSPFAARLPGEPDRRRPRRGDPLSLSLLLDDDEESESESESELELSDELLLLAPWHDVGWLFGWSQVREVEPDSFARATTMPFAS